MSSMYKKIIRPLLFSLGPELAHAVTLQTLRAAYQLKLLNFINACPTKPVQVWGRTFANPVGVAAGLDKDGLCFDALLKLGFGFVEVGGVTVKPQPGNPKPRLFRLPQANALINRMGFNSRGLDHLAARLQARSDNGIIGVNIGRNKETSNEKAPADYVACMQRLYPLTDFMTINISSPNTPGLRELQSAAHLQKLLQQLKTEQKLLEEKHQRFVPLLIKVSVDLTDEQLRFVLDAVMEIEVDGIITSNTSLDRTAVAGLEHAEEVGGLSGKPVHARAVRQVSSINEYTHRQLPIVGVGGIFSAADAKAMLAAGASLVQIYTGLVYQGPGLLKEILVHL